MNASRRIRSGDAGAARLSCPPCLFVDFDGVLRRMSDPKDVLNSVLIGRFEDFLRRMTRVTVVLSTTWRLGYSMKQLRAMFSADIGPRIVGGTPEHDGPPKDDYRHAEVMAWLKANAPEAPWVALDDQPNLYPSGCRNLVVVNGATGIDDVTLLRVETVFIEQLTR